MILNVNYEELKKYVRNFKDDNDLYNFIKDSIDFLYTHNKNLNETQWVKIQDLKSIIDSITIKEDK